MFPDIPAPALGVLTQLHNAGFAAYVVGGCVRDSLLGRVPGDWDITTAARPQQVHEALPGLTVLDTGLQHGTVTAVAEDLRLEITTFRTEGTYSDHRRPDSVTFANTVEEDLSRRDFTVNAMAYSPMTGLVDPFDGQADLKAGILRAVGDPQKRFDEDALRILRGLRFAARLGFALEADTAAAMHRQKHLLSALAQERIRAELLPILCAPHGVEVLRQHRDIFAVILPEIAPMFDFDQQNMHHQYDVWEHTLHTLEHVAPQPDLRLAMLLHDCAKPARFTVDFRGDGHFYGHAARGALIARQALERLRCSQALTQRVVRLIHYHDHDILPSRRSLLRWLGTIGEADLRDLLYIKIADNLAQHPKYLRVERFQQTLALLDALLAEQPCFDRGSLALKGGDLVALGYTGPAVGQALDRLVNAVIDGAVDNERCALLRFLQT
ncbi:MAG: HD domain-containing protein [Clostridia bacterium]|nr:HD domain-containing protein [Clostridia bacterium]